MRALQGASCSLAAGEVHASMEENGARKSTLAKIVAGTIAADGGTFLVWTQARVKDRMTGVLRGHPSIDVLYAHNDPMAGDSAAKASEREKEMIFVSVDGLGGPAGGIKKVRDGILAATFVYPLRQLMAPGMAISRSHPRTGPRTLVGQGSGVNASGVTPRIRNRRIEAAGTQMHLLVIWARSQWCPGPELNRYVSFETRDFKSRASANFATRALTRNYGIVQDLLH